MKFPIKEEDTTYLCSKNDNLIALGEQLMLFCLYQLHTNKETTKSMKVWTSTKNGKDRIWIDQYISIYLNMNENRFLNWK